MEREGPICLMAGQGGKEVCWGCGKEGHHQHEYHSKELEDIFQALVGSELLESVWGRKTGGKQVP
jgi:hypothetical protein